MPTLKFDVNTTAWTSTGVRAPARVDTLSLLGIWLAVANVDGEIADVPGHNLGEAEGSSLVLQGNGLIFVRTDVAASAGIINITSLASQEVVSLARVTTDGTVAAGARGISFANVGGANATVNLDRWKAGFMLDGVHPIAAGNIAMAAPVTAAANTLAVNY